MPYIYSPMQAIEHEFSAYYIADEIPFDWGDDEALEQQVTNSAASSARRLKRLVGDDNVMELVRILREGNDSADTTLVQKLIDITDFEWTEDEYWPTLQSLLGQIASHLQSSLEDEAGG